MQKRFYLDKTVAKGLVGVFGIGFLLMLLPLAISGEFARFSIDLVVLCLALTFLWIGFTYGSYVAIEDDKRVYGKFCFIHGNSTLISEIVSIHRRGMFGGSMSEIYLTYRTKSGHVAQRGLVSKQGMRKDDIERLLDTIRNANPRIKIDPGLLSK
jgi:hypothetical protein